MGFITQIVVTLVWGNPCGLIHSIVQYVMFIVTYNAQKLEFDIW